MALAREQWVRAQNARLRCALYFSGIFFVAIIMLGIWLQGSLQDEVIDAK